MIDWLFVERYSALETLAAVMFALLPGVSIVDLILAVLESRFGVKIRRVRGK